MKKNNVQQKNTIITKSGSKEHFGFTLIEVMVSVSLFAMVMTLSLGAILSIIDGNKKAQAINSVSNNLNFAVDSMVRDIKTGYAYTCSSEKYLIPNPEVASSNVVSGGNGCDNTPDGVGSLSLISTITGTKRSVNYYVSQDPVTNKGRIWRVTSDDPGNQYPVTSAEVDIKTFKFYVTNPVTDYSGQPRVFLVIKGTANVNKTQTSDFAIQTLISQRNLNLPK
jgi:prepilin-type N-terminal cleavage/methylation domain-containing protein